MYVGFEDMVYRHVILLKFADKVGRYGASFLHIDLFWVLFFYPYCKRGMKLSRFSSPGTS